MGSEYWEKGAYTVSCGIARLCLVWDDVVSFLVPSLVFRVLRVSCRLRRSRRLAGSRRSLAVCRMRLALFLRVLWFPRECFVAGKRVVRRLPSMLRLKMLRCRCGREAVWLSISRISLPSLSFSLFKCLHGGLF